MKYKKIYIVEDEPLIADSIKIALEKEKFTVCGIADNFEEVFEDLTTLKPDLVLLDIRLIGQKDGIDVAHEINKNHQIPFIFLTSLSDFDTVERIKITNPAGFINKPFNETGLRNNIEIALHNFQKRNQEKKFNSNESFFIKKKGELIRLKKSDITFVKAYDNYAFIHTEKNKHLVSFTLKAVLEKLSDSRFMRIHKSFVININKIDSLYDGYAFIKNERIPISKMYKENIMQSISLL